ncbi:MAG: 50S ribosomal protein L11 methyltransferase [Magnetovibrionaceae bacterium]
MNQPLLHRLWFDTTQDRASAYSECLEPHVLSVFWTVDEFKTESRVEAVIEGQPAMDRIGEALGTVHDVLGGPKPEPMVEPLAERDWVTENLSQFPPITIGRFFIHGGWFEGELPKGRVWLRVDTGAAFGSGEHATTAGCLLALERLARRGFRPRQILDVGCGTGILGLAAVKAFKGRALGSDFDPLAVKIAAENAALNGAGTSFRTVQASGYGNKEIGRRAPYDLIFCNILARPVRQLAGNLAQHLKPGGYGILSGFYASDFAWVLGPQKAHGLKLIDRIERNGWLTLVVRKPQEPRNSALRFSRNAETPSRKSLVLPSSCWVAASNAS